MHYDVNTDLYDGPLGLLVELSKLNLLDVFLVKLRDLTAQYLAMVKQGGTSLDELAEPLPLFGQLMALKSRLLLPQPPPTEEEEPPVNLEELKARLAEYEQFKTVAQVLAELHALQHEHFTRTGPLEAGELGAEQLIELPAGAIQVGITDLMGAFTKILDRAKAPVYEIQSEPWTVEMKVEELKLTLTVKGRIEFHELFPPEHTKLELVVTFLALLELIRQRLCLAIQEQHFGEIVVIRHEQQG